MNNRQKKPKYYNFLPVLVFIISCTPISFFQSPKTIEPNKSALGIGTLVRPMDIMDAGVYPSAWIRAGISTKSDFGVKVGFPEGLSFDIKYNLINSPIMITGDFGITIPFESEYSTVSFYPTIIVGNQMFFGGYRHIFGFGYDESLYELYIGASFGKKVRIMPEIVLHSEFWQKGHGFENLLPGVGIQYHF